MPGSWEIFDNVVAEVIRKVNPSNILDIGTGWGKYGRMVKDMLPNCKRVGVEVEASYVEKFALKDVYDEMKICDATELMKQHDTCYDVVIIGDCIEHMPKSLGLDFLNFLTYRAKYIIVIAPEFLFQGSVEGVESESHISVWSEADFTWHDAWAFENAIAMSLFILRGYQHCDVSLPAVIEHINKSSIPVYHYTKDKTLRTGQLHANIRRRIEVVDGQEVSFRTK